MLERFMEDINRNVILKPFQFILNFDVMFKAQELQIS